MIDKICLNCGKRFAAKQKRRKYCSLNCSAESNCKKIAKKGAKAMHDKYPQKGKNNFNFKNWRSKDYSYYQRRDKLKYPEKHKAREILRDAVRKGEIIKPNYCTQCFIVKSLPEIHGHHEDYSKPLKIEWLCRDCHTTKHKK